MNESKRLSTMNSLALEINSTLADQRQNKYPAYDHSASNWASEIHHPCLRHLVYLRLNWQDKKLIDIEGAWKVEEGIDQEWTMTKLLGNCGYKLNKSQTKLPPVKEQITGKIDGTISKDGFEYPVEIKSINPNFWESTKTIEDLKHHSKWWLQKIPSQLNLYLYMMNKEGGFLLFKTFGKAPRILPMTLDYELADYDLKLAEKVNAFVAKKEYPDPIPYDSSVCSMCGFDHICKPLKATEYVEASDLDYWKLEEFLEAKEQAKKYEQLKAELIGTKEKPGQFYGKNAIVNDIEIKTSIQQRNFYEIPDEIKRPYSQKREVIITTIERL